MRTRCPRIILAALAGGGLAFAGVLFQALLRDALADPHIIGVSSGASLGAVTAICAGWQTIGALPAVWVAAFLGASGMLLLILLIASEDRRISSFTLLLSAVTVTTTGVPPDRPSMTLLLRMTSCGGSMLICAPLPAARAVMTPLSK